jgi:molecular chaperone DnaK
VEKMAKDAETHTSDDRKKKEEIESRNRADAMVYNIEKMLKEHRDKVSESDANAVEEALDETKKAMSEGGIDKINQATSKLETASHKLAEAMYKSASQTAGAPGAQQGDGKPAGDAKPKDGKKDDVVDAEFVDVDDKK